jgi:hypothetical protein
VTTRSQLNYWNEERGILKIGGSFRGDYSTDYGADDGFTRLRGVLSITAGSLVPDNLVIFGNNNFVAGTLEAAETRDGVHRADMWRAGSRKTVGVL